MSDDWQWFWAGEGGRDRILRDEVEGLHARLSSASSRTHRLSSQLATLSGSIESRLNALSRAFDAYVELGDVREELAAYEESATVRRAVLAAIEALAGGRTAERLDPRGLDYWLPYAMNAVIGLVEGHPDRAAHERARALAPETDLFVVATCGALGHGSVVADLVPTVLIGDQELTQPQRAVWRAVATGVYGDRVDGLAELWRPLLDREPVAGWSAWVAIEAPAPSAGISWLRALVTDTADGSVPQPAPGDRAPLTVGPLPGMGSAELAEEPAAGSVTGLRGVVTELIGRGLPAEADLLRRARELRARIEDPGATTAPSAEAEPATVVAEVRRALLRPSTSPRVRATLLSWVASPLSGVVDELAAAAAAAPATRETIRAAGTVVVVTPTGADPAAVADGVSRIQRAYVVQSTPLIGWAVGTGLVVLLTLVLAIAGSGWAWFFGLLAIAGGVGLLHQLRVGRARKRAGAEAVQRFHQEVAEATAKADSIEQRRTALLLQLTGEAAEVRGRLATLAALPVGAAGPTTDQEPLTRP